MYTESSIRAALQTPQLRLILRDTLPSTNDVLVQMAKQGAPHGTVLLARTQTDGHGRMGRSFFSPPDTGVYMSVLLRPQWTMRDCLSVTPIAAVAAAKAVHSTLGRPVQIKWVNDLYDGGKKICGILTTAQASPEGDRAQWIVVGVGINFFPPASGFPQELRQTAGALLPRSKADVQSRWIAAFLDGFFAHCAFPDDPEILRCYRAHDYLLGKRVELRGGVCVRGTAAGIDDRFRLRIRLPDGSETAVDAGEAHVLCAE